MKTTKAEITRVFRAGTGSRNPTGAEIFAEIVDGPKNIVGRSVKIVASIDEIKDMAKRSLGHREQLVDFIAGLQAEVDAIDSRDASISH
jgi:hypothetical protein